MLINYLRSALEFAIKPIFWWALAVVFNALVAKAPLPSTWIAWAAAIATIATGIAGLLTNPQHLMNTILDR